MYRNIVFNLVGQTRREMLNGRQHVVVPASILEEGVWEGSGGKIFYPQAEIDASVPGWDHKPAVVYHPDNNGTPISACDPVVLNTRGVGLVLRTKAGGKLDAEVWLDEDRTKAIDNRILEALHKGDKVEVSTGLSVDLEQTPGEFNGKKYDAIARNFRPDHLAILPDKPGAYSVKDGGGMGGAGILTFNQRAEPERNTVISRRTAERALEHAGFKLVDNEISFSDASSQLSDLLAAKFGEPGKYWDGYICEVFPSYVVFKNGYGPDAQLFVIDYSMDGNAVSLSGDAIRVERVVKYQTEAGTYVGNAAGRLEFTPKKEESPKVAFDKAKHVDGLIANGQFHETDREALMATPDATLVKLRVTNAAPPPAPAPAPAPAPTPTPTPADNYDQYIANSPPGFREMMVEGRNAANAERAVLSRKILNHPKNRLSKDQLSATPLENLRAIADYIPDGEDDDDYVDPGRQLRPLVGNGSAPLQNHAAAAGGANRYAAQGPPPASLPLPSIEFENPFGKRGQ